MARTRAGRRAKGARIIGRVAFGSHARGQASPHSDVDLLVVTSFRGTRSRKQAEIRLALNDYAVAKDIVVTTPEDLAWRSQVPGTIERSAPLELLSVYQIERHIRRERDDGPNRLKKEIALSPQFQALWDRIKPKTTFDAGANP